MIINIPEQVRSLPSKGKELLPPSLKSQNELSEIMEGMSIEDARKFALALADEYNLGLTNDDVKSCTGVDSISFILLAYFSSAENALDTATTEPVAPAKFDTRDLEYITTLDTPLLPTGQEIFDEIKSVPRWFVTLFAVSSSYEERRFYIADFMYLLVQWHYSCDKIISILRSMERDFGIDVFKKQGAWHYKGKDHLYEVEDLFIRNLVKKAHGHPTPSYNCDIHTISTVCTELPVADNWNRFGNRRYHDIISGIWNVQQTINYLVVKQPDVPYSLVSTMRGVLALYSGKFMLDKYTMEITEDTFVYKIDEGCAEHPIDLLCKSIIMFLRDEDRSTYLRRPISNGFIYMSPLMFLRPCANVTPALTKAELIDYYKLVLLRLWGYGTGLFWGLDNYYKLDYLSYNDFDNPTLAYLYLILETPYCVEEYFEALLLYPYEIATQADNLPTDFISNEDAIAYYNLLACAYKCENFVFEDNVESAKTQAIRAMNNCTTVNEFGALVSEARALSKTMSVDAYVTWWDKKLSAIGKILSCFIDNENLSHTNEEIEAIGVHDYLNLLYKEER